MVMFCILGPMAHYGNCDKWFIGPLERVASVLQMEYDTVLWIVSVAYWYNEYAFALLSIGVQLYGHWEMELWDFVGDKHMPVAFILSRFSIYRSILRQLFWLGGNQDELNLLLPQEQQQQQEAEEAQQDDTNKTESDRVGGTGTTLSGTTIPTNMTDGSKKEETIRGSPSCDNHYEATMPLLSKQ